jgi:hypothetical protein
MPIAAVNSRAAWIDWKEPAEPELLRRLDWRFLLHAHELDCVGYLGPSTGVLANALCTFSHTMQVLGRGPMQQASVDLIVASGVDARRVSAALPALKAGGSLYWELPKRRNPFGRAWPALDVRDLGRPELFWHYPSFEECRLIISLDQPAPLTSLVRQRITRIDPALLRTAVDAVMRKGVLPRVLSSVSVVARKAAHERSR